MVLGALTPRLWRRRPPRLVGLSVVIVSMVIANAFVTGALSMVEYRFPSRVIWLLSLVAGLFVLDWLDHWQRPETEAGEHGTAWQSPQRLASRCLTELISAQADARIHGIGRLWGSLWAFRTMCKQASRLR